MENTKKGLSIKSVTWLLSLLYFASYVTRINFAAVMQEIITDLGYAKSVLSVVTVGLSITYGAGQIVNGWIGDKVKPQNLILCGLSVATLINLIFPLFSFSVTAMTVLWAVNGFAQAMMWPPIVKILVGCTTEEEYGYAVVRISWGSSIGTIFVYLVAPLVITLFSWEAVFITSAVIGLSVTVFWYFMRNKVGEKKTEKSETLAPAPTKFTFPKAAIFPIVFIALGIIFQGMLRDGVTNWMPTYLAEVFDFGNSTSILCTVLLAVFSIISFSVAGAVYKKFFKNEVFCGGVIFALASVFAGLMFLFFEAGAAFSILCMSVLTGAMHGVNLMLITHVPKRFKKYGNISTISGAINSCTYIGSAIFTYAIAVFAEALGWQATVGIWVLIALLGTACCLIAYKPWQKFVQEGEKEKTE